jgi:glycine C-acetyltransferase/8-amino-7-oxononanoate synthase
MTIESELAELRARSLFESCGKSARLRACWLRSVESSSSTFRRTITSDSPPEPSLQEAAKAAIDRYGVGAGASRLVCGTLTPHVQLEKALAAFKKTEAALSFSSGYAAAVGTLGALLQRDDVVILDKLAHASLIDGARLSGASVRVFPHNHMGKLESHLQWARDNHPDGRVVVVTESVFSMDGDWALLPEIVEVKNRYGALLLLMKRTLWG